jgi:hypothetical protein
VQLACVQVGLKRSKAEFYPGVLLHNWPLVYHWTGCG